MTLYKTAAIWSTGLVFLVLSVTACGTTSEDLRPNVLVIVVDDLGPKDLAIYGSEYYQSPNIDRLANKGVRFDQFYAASSVCSPTRASIMTGLHPARVKITNWIGGMQNGILDQADYEMSLKKEYPTMGEVFSKEGYKTSFIGKWHLGDGDAMPGLRGFEHTFGVNEAGQPASYYFPFRRKETHPSNVPDLAKADSTSYLTDELSREALRYLKEESEDPFMMVLSYYSVHTPIQARQDLIASHELRRRKLYGSSDTPFEIEANDSATRKRQDNPDYAAMIESVDSNLGKILDYLDSSGLSENTILVFTSDNGGLSTLANRRSTAPTSNDPLRAGKGWLYEGGVRMPFLISWPSKVDEGKASSVPAMSTDILPTILDLAGLEKVVSDGESLLPLLNDSGELGVRSLYWHFPHYHGSGNRPSGSIRSDEYKLIEWFEDDRVELFNLALDPSESRDLSSEDPERASQLVQELRKWRSEIDAEMPKRGTTSSSPVRSEESSRSQFETTTTNYK